MNKVLQGRSAKKLVLKVFVVQNIITPLYERKLKNKYDKKHIIIE
jgi:hypothetical protein